MCHLAMQPKLIYLAQRRPDMSGSRWKNIARYAHCADDSSQADMEFNEERTFREPVVN
jgi:hypothetical protein